MAKLCDKCLHHSVCARQCRQAAEHGCAYFMGWIPVEESLPPVKDFPYWSHEYGQKRSDRVVTVDAHWDFLRVQVSADGRFVHGATHWLKGLVLPKRIER